MTISLVCLLTGQAVAGVGTTLFLSAHAIVGLVVLAGGGFDVACDDATKEQIASKTSYNIKKYFGVDEHKEDSPFIKNVRQLLMNRNAGYFLLPTEGGEESLIFSELAFDQAKKIGITLEEMEDYNDNIEEVNAILETVAIKIEQIVELEGLYSSNLSYKESLRAWMELGDLSEMGSLLQTCSKIAEYQLNDL